MALRWIFNSAFSLTLVHSSDQKTETTQKVDFQAKKNGANSFRMPLHYPLYKKADYEEWKVDNLLKQYGLDLHVKGSLDEKRNFTMA
ncbi:unnamed protein product [Amaranthus hypochondriacus]